MSTTVAERAPKQAAGKNPARARRPPHDRKTKAGAWRPSERNRTIFERRALGGEPLAALALEYKVTHQRIAQITLRVEGWIVAHPEDRLAQRMRLRCRLRYETVYDAAMTGFAASRREEVTLKERKTRRPAPASEASDSAETKEVVTTVEERIVRQRHGDPRLLATALKAVEKLERLANAVGEEQSATGTEAPMDKQEADQNREVENREATNQETNDQEVDDQEAENASSFTPRNSALPRSERQHELPPSPLPIGPSDAPQPQAGSRLAGASFIAREVATNAGGEGTSGRIALCRRGPVVLIANGGHLAHMRSVAERALPRNQVIALGGEKQARTWLTGPHREAALIWLEDNLSGRPGGAPSSLELARTLAARGADCPVLIGEGGPDGESSTLHTLRAAGLRVEVVRRGGEGWIQRNWLPMLARLVA